MRMVSITEIRRNAKAVLADLAKTKKPIAILQRSKPVAYIIDADSFMMLQIKDDNELAETRKKSLEKILHIKERVAQKTGKQEDSVNLIRELREGANRYE
jgi:prevent-host-death family protein